MSKKEEFEETTVSLVSTSTEIRGNIISKGDIRINGKLIGDIVSDQKIVIGDQGHVEGNIQAKDCDVWGYVAGNITIDGMLLLTSSAKVQGDITVKKLTIEPDAQFIGTCKMTNNYLNEE